MRKFTFLAVCLLLTAASAVAQSKFDGACKQGKPDPNHMVTVGDKTMVLGKVTCTWSSGDLNGDKIRTEEDVFTSDMMGKTSKDTGYGVGTTAGGDKYFVAFTGTTNYDKNNPTSATCAWHFTGGTGKLKGLTGKGTCTGKYDASGASTFAITGTYSVAAAKK